MADNMSDIDSKCEGCVEWKGSYNQYPCNVCNNVFSGFPKNWYEVKEEVVKDPCSCKIPKPGKVILTNENMTKCAICGDELTFGGLPQNDVVKHPKHYKIGDMEAIDIIKKTLTKEQFNGYLLGNILKYRLRAGKKDNTEQDILKALQYEEFWEMYND